MVTSPADASRLVSSVSLRLKSPVAPLPTPMVRVAEDGMNKMFPVPTSTLPVRATSAAVIVIVLLVTVTAEPASFDVNVPVLSSLLSASMVRVPLVVISAPAPASVTPS